MKIRYIVTVLASGALVAGVACTASATTPLVNDINHLKVAKEVRTGYLRSKFPATTVSGCTTRARVLKQENKGVLRYKPGTCTVVSGKWYSVWDGKTYLRASSLQVDHTVALAEAWDSGARSWTTARRKSYANDLTSTLTLNAITSSLNTVKGDKDVTGWMPTKNRCLYIKEQVAIKKRWALSVNATEKAALLKYAKGC